MGAEVTQPQFENGVPVAVNPDDQKAPDAEGHPYAVEDNDLSGYVGVSPEYQTYANETEKPDADSNDAEVEAAAKANAPLDGEPSDDDGDVEPYEEWSVIDLEKEVATRNADRAEDDKIVVDGTGSNGNVVKADLVKALENDDA
jgi:hypothetical protein